MRRLVLSLVAAAAILVAAPTIVVAAPSPGPTGEIGEPLTGTPGPTPPETSTAGDPAAQSPGAFAATFLVLSGAGYVLVARRLRRPR